MSRSRNYVIAAVLAGLLSLANTIVALAVLPQGAHHINHSSDQPPYAVLVVEVIVGLTGMVAASPGRRASTEPTGPDPSLARMIARTLNMPYVAISDGETETSTHGVRPSDRPLADVPARSQT